jgi:cytochrome P450
MPPPLSTIRKEDAEVHVQPVPDWDPRDPAVLDDQRRAYDAMRERCPIAYSEFLGWSLFRHDDISHVLADPHVYSSATKRLAVPNGMDPPQHTLYRSALEPYFEPRQLLALEPQSRRIAIDLLQLLVGRDDVDFIAEFAHPFPMQTFCTFVGWPTEDWERICGWTHGNQQAAFMRDRAMGAAFARAFADQVEEMLRQRRERGLAVIDDITARLMQTEVEGQPLSDDAIVSLLRTWTAGHGTIASALGILALHLAMHPELQRQLRAEPGLLATAIDEILRVDGPLVSNRRTTKRDVEIDGRAIAAGENLTLMWIAANRDPRAFEEPDAARLNRDERGNLLFGAGIHECLGASLARLELRVAMEELLARTTAIALTSATSPVRSTYPSNGLETLMLSLR